MLKCKDIAHQSSEYIDDNMSFRQKLAMKVHLFMCRNCRRFVDHLSTSVVVSKGITQKALREKRFNCLSSELNRHPDKKASELIIERVKQGQD
jgi:hypothetical protein